MSAIPTMRGRPANRQHITGVRFCIRRAPDNRWYKIAFNHLHILWFTYSAPPGQSRASQIARRPGNLCTRAGFGNRTFLARRLCLPRGYDWRPRYPAPCRSSHSRWRIFDWIDKNNNLNYIRQTLGTIRIQKRLRCENRDLGVYRRELSRILYIRSEISNFN